jgi:hypothetical protein
MGVVECKERDGTFGIACSMTGFVCNFNARLVQNISNGRTEKDIVIKQTAFCRK